MKSPNLKLFFHRRPRSRSKAQGMVEFALALPVFLMLILGIIEFGWLFYTYSATFSAAREAARYGASVGTNASGVEHVLDCAGIRDAAIRIGGPVGVTADTVEIVYDTGPDDARSWDALPTCDDQPITALADRIRVRITLPFDPLIGILPDITITNTSHRTIIRDVELGGNPPPPPPVNTYTPVPLNTPTPTVTPTATATNTATPTPTSTPEVWADVSVEKTDGTHYYTAGTTTTYTIVVRNAGPNDVTGVVINDSKPGQITSWTWTCTQAGASGCDGVTNSTSNFSDVVDLTNGGVITYTVTAQIAADATGVMTNIVLAEVPEGVGDENPDNNRAADVDYPPTADLQAAKTDGLAVYLPDQTLTYLITVSNIGPDAAMNASVTDLRPAQVASWEWICAGASNGASGCDGAPDGTADFSDIVSLPAGSSISYTVNARVAADATGDLVNTVTILPPMGLTDPDLTNNQATDTDTPPMADISVTKSDLMANYTRGSITYLITVNNSGPNPAEGVIVNDAFPAGDIVTSWSWTCLAPIGGATGCDPAGDGVYDFSDVIDLPAVSSITYQVTANIWLDANTTLVNSVSITPPDNVLDPNLANNVATDVDDPPVFSCNNLTATAAGSIVDNKLQVTLNNNTHYRGTLILAELAFVGDKPNKSSRLTSITFDGPAIYSTSRNESATLFNIPGASPDDWLMDGGGNYIDRTVDPRVLGVGGTSNLQLVFYQDNPEVVTVNALYLTFTFNTNPPTTCRYGDLK